MRELETCFREVYGLPQVFEILPENGPKRPKRAGFFLIFALLL